MQVETHRNAQVVVQTNRGTHHHGGDQPPQAGLNADRQHVEFADKAQRHWDTCQRQHHHRHHRGKNRTVPEQTTVRVQGVGIRAAERAGHQADHAKRAEAAEQITGQINAYRFHRHLAALQGNQRHQQIAEVRDRRVTEQTFDVGLAQRHQVTEDDRGKGDNAQHHAYRFAVAYRRIQEQTHHHAEDSDFARRRQEGGNRRRRALVNVWRPQVERHQREFKAQTDNHQAKARQQQRLVQHTIAEALTERFERQVAGLRVHQRHPEQQERRGGGGEDGVFDTGFQRAFLAESITNQAEQRQ